MGSIQVNPSSKYFVSTSKECVNVWYLSPLRHLLKIPTEESKVSDRTLAAIDKRATLLVVYKRFETVISLYEIDIEKKLVAVPKTIDIKHELGRSVLDGLSEDEQELVVEVRFVNKSRTIRCYQ